MNKLLLDDPISFYWAGFIAADGHVTKDHRLVIQLAEKDLNHLKKFAKFIDYKGSWGKSGCRLQVMNKKVLKEFTEKFNMTNRKTYNPVKIPDGKDNLFFSFLIGFIDGDGCISLQTNRTTPRLTIKCHKSWENTLNNWVQRFYVANASEGCARFFPPTCNIREDKYAEINIANHELLWKTYCIAHKLKLPYLKRKWDIITYPSFRYQKAEQTKKQIQKMYLDGLRQIDIAKNLNLTKGYVSMVLCGRR